jgi:hypothetical protein
MNASDYYITADDHEQALFKGMQTLLEKDVITVQKHGKSGTKAVDIRPMISCAKQEERGILMRLWASAQGALSPSLLMPALWESAGRPPETPFGARRIDLVTRGGLSLLNHISGT